MKILFNMTIIVSKLIIKACRLFRRGGTNLPGKIAIKLYPKIIKEITTNYKIIMVTGTNGKTTTTRIIEQMLIESNLAYITNKSGANLISGITTTFINSFNLFNKQINSIALIEIDEAAFNAITNHIEPDILVVTNFFRDQLDRYGELYTTLKGVKAGVEKSINTKLILNADDSLCSSIGINNSKEIIYYGIDKYAYNNIDEMINNDASFCINCKNKYVYENHIYGHLGWFKCENCGYERPISTVTCSKIHELNSSFSSVEIESMGGTVGQVPLSHSVKINLPGLYNIYNSLAAVACGTLLDIPTDKIITSLSKFECGFGRMETINVSNKNIKLILVKNPTGFNQVLNFLATEDKKMQIAFLINDNLADGTDISWLWDVDFEKLQNIENNISNVYTSGIRSLDMAVRLKYAGINVNKITTVNDYNALIDTGLSNTQENHNFYILPTYTAMLDIRAILQKKFNLKEFWK